MAAGQWYQRHGGSGVEEPGVRGDTHPAKIEAIRIETGADGRVIAVGAVGVPATGGDELFKGGGFKFREFALVEVEGQRRTPGTVTRVAVFVFTAGIMEQGE